MSARETEKELEATMFVLELEEFIKAVVADMNSQDLAETIVLNRQRLKLIDHLAPKV